jgi:hypothetical protein
MLENETGGQGPSEDIDTDALLESVQGEEHEIPMTAPAQQAAPTPEEFELNVNGKLIKAPKDQMIKWAQMGYDAPNRIGEINKQLETYKSQSQKWAEAEAKYSKYGPVDEYFSKNPDHWKVVEETWKSKQAAFDPNNPIAAELNNVKNVLQDLTKFKDEISSKEVAQKRQAEDAELKQDIESIRKAYPDLDWDTPNEHGQSLEKQIVEHAIKSKIESFRAAFRDFTFDQHVKKAQETGMQKRDKDIQKRTKLGLLGETRTPTRGISNAKDVKNQSYEALMNEALEELREGAS